MDLVSNFSHCDMVYMLVQLKFGVFVRFLAGKTPEEEATVHMLADQVGQIHLISFFFSVLFFALR